ncbi:MAG: SH3 domain-containing protein, partial [Syntrophomonadaceae bacterium]|nr:SH3 domain-containing protein [Syntrophomonadaceae bacterium]
MVSKEHVPTRAVQPASDAGTSGGYITPAAGVSRPSSLGRAWMALLLGLCLLLSPLAGLSRPLLAATTATVTASVLNIRGGPGTSYAKVGTLLQGARITVLEQGGEWLKIQYNGNSTGWVSRSLVSLDAPAAAASSSSGVKTAAVGGATGTAVVTAASANLRAGAGTGFAVTGSVKKGDVLSVYSSSSGWYLVKTATGTSGYVAGWLVSYTPGGAVAAPSAGGNTSAAASTAAAASPSSGAIGTATVKGAVLNLRSGPGTSWAVAGKATQGQKLAVLAKQGDWLKVRTAGGVTAWAAAWLVTFTPAASNTAAGAGSAS